MTTSLLPIVSVVIATYNSARTLPLVLKALSQQTYPKNRLEIVLVDGGSTDTTLKLGKKFKCKIIKNPLTEPLHAKYLGYTRSKGKYILYLDHDEVLQNPDSLKNKVSCLEKEKRVKAVLVSGYENPRGYPFINNYINDFGDPFSFFIYRLSKNNHFFLKEMVRRYGVITENEQYSIFNLQSVKQTPIIELCAGGSMFDASFMKKKFPQTVKTAELIPHFFYLLNKTNSCIAITKNDALLHYSSDTLQKYLNKIRWRVKNNIYHSDYMGKAGYTGREVYHQESKIKKYLFFPYVYSIIFCLYDSLSLIISRRNFLYIFHLPLSFFTANLIIYHTIRHILGDNPLLKSYDESKVVARK